MISFGLWWPEASKESPTAAPTGESTQVAATDPTGAQMAGISLPGFAPLSVIDAVIRQTNAHTEATSTEELVIEAREHVVSKGDSIFGIAQDYKISPETILWANDQLDDNPDMISLGVKLTIPPTTGIYYKWQEGDTLQSVADRYHAKVDDIVAWPGNKIDLSDPKIETGTYIMIPDGWREFVQWVVPTIPRGPAGVLKTTLGPGACDTNEGGYGGSGWFVWPADNHFISGNDYWSGHLAIDIAAGEGANIYAADSGVVVFAGWSYGGYGNMVMIDHANGYQTVYAHLSRIVATCGQSVASGQRIGFSGNTGNSFGAHLHFEVRYLGGWISPWTVLP